MARTDVAKMTVCRSGVNQARATEMGMKMSVAGSAYRRMSGIQTHFPRKAVAAHQHRSWTPSLDEHTDSAGCSWECRRPVDHRGSGDDPVPSRSERPLDPDRARSARE